MKVSEESFFQGMEITVTDCPPAFYIVSRGVLIEHLKGFSTTQQAREVAHRRAAELLKTTGR